MEENKEKETSELEKCQKEKGEYLNNWKRERADFLNYKKDEAKRLEEFIRFANEAVVLEVIDILDDLERAAKEIKSEGLSQVLKKFQELLKKYSVERIGVEGAFDPLLHEAVALGGEAGASSDEGTSRATSEGGEQSEVPSELQEVRAGYTMYGQVIRPARVKIIK